MGELEEIENKISETKEKKTNLLRKQKEAGEEIAKELSELGLRIRYATFFNGERRRLEEKYRELEVKERKILSESKEYQELKNLQDSLLSRKYLLLGKKEEEEEKKFEKKKKDFKKIRINLNQWFYQRRFNPPKPYEIIYLTGKRELRILNQICLMYNLNLYDRSDLTDYYCRKYKRFRLTELTRGKYLLPLVRKT